MSKPNNVSGRSDAEKAFEEFADQYDLESNEWLDMNVQQMFIHGWQARAAASDQATGRAVDLLPNALWTRHGSGSCEWWTYRGYEARKDSADQWVLRKGGNDLYRHTYLQVVMAHAEREILAAAPSPAAREAGDAVTLTDDEIGLIETAAHQWAIAAYNKALGRPFADIDQVREKFRALLREAGSR
ncbi:hypothetical protein ACXIVK_24205 [Paraburkholderia caledonica]